MPKRKPVDHIIFRAGPDEPEMSDESYAVYEKQHMRHAPPRPHSHVYTGSIRNWVTMNIAIDSLETKLEQFSSPIHMKVLETDPNTTRVDMEANLLRQGFALRALAHLKTLREAIERGDLALAVLSAMFFALHSKEFGTGEFLPDVWRGARARQRGKKLAPARSTKSQEHKAWVIVEYESTLTLDNDKAEARKRVRKAFPYKFPNDKVPADSTIESYVKKPRKTRSR